MIAEAATEFDVTSTLKPAIPEGAIEMTFDETAKYHLMSVMTNMYDDSVLACIREYSTNAWDSHVEAGNTSTPIEVELPSRLNAFFVVRDFGVGMDADMIRNIYSKYGASTKRGTNEQTGMLGIGCKAALSYAPQFTLVGVKDGVRTQVIISRDSDGSGQMMIVDESETDDPNGVTISIPTTQFDVFETKALRFFQHWEEGRVLLNGTDPSQVGDYFEVSDGILIGPENEHDEVRGWNLVMGGVSYPIPTNGVDVFRQAVDIIPPNRISIVCHVPMGSVTFSPSREGLQLGAPNTIATLKDLETRLLDGILTTSAKQVADAGSKMEAAALSARWDRFFRMRRWDYSHYRQSFWTNVKFQYDGEDVSEHLREEDSWYIVSRRSGNLGTHTTTDRVQLFEVDRHVSPLTDITVEMSTSTLWVSRFTHKNFTSSTKRILRQYAPNAERFVLKKDSEFTTNELELLEGSTVVDWETVRKAYKRPTTSTSSTTGRSRGGTFNMYDSDTETWVQKRVDEIPDGTSVYWCGTHSTLGTHTWCTLLSYALDVPFVLVRVPANREAKFLRDVPRAIESTSKYFIDLDIEDKVRDAIGTKALEAMKYGRAIHYGVSKVDPTQIDDPELRKYYEYQALGSKNGLTETHRTVIRCLNRLGIDIDVKTYNPTLHYPLLTGANTSYGVDEHLYEYLNWAYAQRQAKSTQP